VLVGSAGCAEPGWGRVVVVGALLAVLRGVLLVRVVLSRTVSGTAHH
jgi:hypothetical protein